MVASVQSSRRGPAETPVTAWIEQQANRLLAEDLRAVLRLPYARPHLDHTRMITSTRMSATSVRWSTWSAIRRARLRIGVDPLGGAGVAYWAPIIERYGLDVQVVNDAIDPTFRFMTLDWDGRIRMDCSSPYAMAGLIALKDRFDLAFGNDTDHDRHGIVTRSAGLLNPNHYLAVAIAYLFGHRPGRRADAAVVVSSSLIDRVTARLGRRLVEVPVGFKWFVDGLLDGSVGFAGEESAGASFLRFDGTVWTTDKDGIILGLLAAEMLAITGRDPGELYRDLTGSSASRSMSASMPRRHPSRRKCCSSCHRNRFRPQSWRESRSWPCSPRHPAMAAPSAASR